MKAIKVLKEDNGWVVTETKAIYDTQVEAISVARGLAKRNNALLVVHKANGEVYPRKTVNYTKHVQPHIYGKRNFSNKDILASIISIKEEKFLQNNEKVAMVACR